eukprot:TRINITY_DN11372_c0_g1_i3.p1 TRINITY_DN11372_c0_g1~~TRINITY_DN11372_c0_g1_i3.p1  ORF type:complete len:441 (+),score=57.61 TRINITY_DN11372_c0_g1_i3:93-1415(+)
MPHAVHTTADIRGQLRDTIAWAHRMRAERDRALAYCSKLNYQLSATQGHLGRARRRLRDAHERLRGLQATLDNMTQCDTEGQKTACKSQVCFKDCRKVVQEARLRAATAESQLLPHSEAAFRTALQDAEASLREELVAQLSSALLLQTERTERTAALREEAVAYSHICAQSYPPTRAEGAHQEGPADGGDRGAGAPPRTTGIFTDYDLWCAQQCIPPRLDEDHDVEYGNPPRANIFFSEDDWWRARECMPTLLDSTDDAQDLVKGPSAEASAAVQKKVSEVLFIDHICYWVAAFAPSSWAPVCGKSARMVAGVIKTYENGWLSVGRLVGSFQSMGVDYKNDHRAFGPERGPIHTGSQEIESLKQKVLHMPHLPGRGYFVCCWLLHMDFTKHLYEEMRLRHKQMYLMARFSYVALAQVYDTLEEVLEMYDRRTAEEQTAAQ